MIDPQIIEEIKFRNDIESVVSSYVTLKRAGSNFSGSCPFHSEKTPSFVVFPSTQSYYCFGCGAGGDAISFVMRAENLDYISAIKMLAQRGGINLPDDIDGGEKQKGVSRQRVLDMNKEAAKFFNKCLMDEKIGANARESNNAQSSADFINKLSIALKEADETAYWLELLHESGIIDEQHFSSMYSDLKELIALLTASIKTSKQNNNIKKVESGKMKDESFPTSNSEK